MHRLESALGWLRAAPPARAEVGACIRRQLLCFCRGDALFVFNLHPARTADEVLWLWREAEGSRPEGAAAVSGREPLLVLLNSDELALGGRGRRARVADAPPGAPTLRNLDGACCEAPTARGAAQAHARPVRVCVPPCSVVVVGAGGRLRQWPGEDCRMRGL